MYQKLNQNEAHNERLMNKYIKIFFAVLLYWIVSIITVFVNKTLLSGVKGLDAPLFVTWFQCVVTSSLCLLLKFLGKVQPRIFSFPDGTPLDFELFRKILPVALLFTLMIGANNLCLKYVGVAFYFIGRSLTTVFNVLLTYIVLHQKTSWKSILCCLGIVGGFFLGVDQESLTEAFSLKGTVFGVLGSFSLAMYSIQTKKALTHVNEQILLLNYCVNVYSCVIFLPLIILNGELESILAFEDLLRPWFLGVMLLGGVCGFAIGFVTTLQIKVTSPLTHNISGTAKACAQTVIATQFYNESKSVLWWLSNIVVLFCSMAYTRVRQLEMKREHNRNNVAQKA